MAIASGIAVVLSLYPLETTRSGKLHETHTSGICALESGVAGTTPIMVGME